MQVLESVVSMRVTARPVLTGGKGSGGRRPGDSAGREDPGEGELGGVGGAARDRAGGRGSGEGAGLGQAEEVKE